MKRSLLLLALIATAVAVLFASIGACSGKVVPRGGLMLVIRTDGTLAPDRLHVDVTSTDSATTYRNADYAIPAEATLPTTLAIASNGDPTASVVIDVSVWTGPRPLDLRQNQVQEIPTDRVAELDIVLSAKCSPEVTAVGGQAQSKCPPGQTCDPTTGGCVNDIVSGGGLPTYSGGEEAPDAACLARQVDTQNGVFVFAAGTSSPTCGDIGTPCSTVQLGLDRAHALGRSVVYVGASAAPYVGATSLYAGIDVEGGWNVASSTWSPVCTSDPSAAVVIQAPPSSNITVAANSLGGSAKLRTLTIASKAHSDVKPGESIYGVIAAGLTTTLALEDVVVRVEAAGDGTSGSSGDAGAGAPDGCTASSANSGAPGAAGAPGAGSDGGTFSDAGYVPGSGVSAGGIGSPGNAGTAGQSTCKNNASSCHLVPQGQCGDPCTTTGSGPACAAGLPGCGGGPGTGGALGTGGGSSIAVYSWGANVTVSGGALVAGDSGNGGAGGAGGVGGSGSAGQPQTTTYGCGCGGACCATAQCSVTSDGGGGTGGTGGVGGQGGGGAGGWSCAYYAGGSGNVAIGNGVVLAHGNAGSGGPAGGATGVGKDRCP